jgi:hypothetical protein
MGTGVTRLVKFGGSAAGEANLTREPAGGRATGGIAGPNDKGDLLT